MKIAIYSQYYENNEPSVTVLLDLLRKKGLPVFIEQQFYHMLDTPLDMRKNYPDFKSFDELDESFDLLISIGGDGTILRAVTFVRDMNIPIVGVNTGRLGFLATIQTDSIAVALDSILMGDYKISERSLLSVRSEPKNEAFQDLRFALNEVAINRKNTTSMITISTDLDGEHLTSYWADGLIISTPTGSTGYSLSCGGPVISPSTNSFVVTPIAPHNLNARPLVIPDETEITLQVSGREDYFLISLDSRIASLHNDTLIHIKKAPFTIKFIELHTESFINTLRKKLLWGEDRRN